MANKTSFILFNELGEPVNNLSDEDAGKLFKAIFEYQNGGIVQDLSPQAEMAFTFIRQQFDRSNEQYERICERNRANGAKGGRPPNPENPVGSLVTQSETHKPKKPKLTLPDPDPDPKKEAKKEDKKEYKPDVYLTEAEYTRLTTDYKKADVDGIVDDLSNALGNNYPKDKYKDHNKTIRKWLKRSGIMPISPVTKCRNCGKPYTGTLCQACGEIQNGQI